MNSTISLETCCSSYEVLGQCSRRCNQETVDDLSQRITGQLWLVDAMLLVNAILAGVIVGIGAYGHRYRHYGFTRYLLLGATTLFAPVISYVLSATGSTGWWFILNYETSGDEITAQCFVISLHKYLVMVSSSLVLISAINASRIVATDEREDGTIRPPFELLLKGIWIAYMVAIGGVIYLEPGKPLDYFRITPLVLIPAKMVLRSYAFLKAQKSFALGRNPRLIIGYMQQLREGSDHHGEPPLVGDTDVAVPPPSLVVTGEVDRQVEKQPHGYKFSTNLEALQEGGLVTLDKVWRFSNIFLIPMQQLKDICLSFALFKLLRCRFVRYKFTDDVISRGALNFFRSVLLKEGEHDRAFMMIADELSFLHDYYDSPLPISYSDCWLTAFSMVISVLSIGYYMFCGMDIINVAHNHLQSEDRTHSFMHLPLYSRSSEYPRYEY